MKLIKIFLNTLMLALCFCLGTAAEWGIYNLIAMPEQTSRIALVDNGENVAYFDTFSWYGTDIKESLDMTDGPRHSVTSWSNYDWWKKGMRWADYAVEAVTGTIVPIFSPTYEVKQLAKYRLDEDEDYLVFVENNDEEIYTQYLWDGKAEVSTISGGYGSYSSIDVMNNEEITKEFVFKESVYLPFTEQYHEKSDKLYLYADVGEGQRLYNYDFDAGTYTTETTWGQLLNVAQSNTNPSIYVKCEIGGSTLYYHFMTESIYSGGWKSACKSFNKFYWKVLKYNDASYDHWVNKFNSGVLDKNGDFVVKSSVPALYFQFYLAIVFAIWFVYQNPIVVDRTENGENSVKGGMKLGFRHRKKGKK